MDKAFTDIKQMIDDHPTLYFFNPEVPVFLQTELTLEDRTAEAFLGEDEWRGVEQIYTLEEDDNDNIVTPWMLT